MNYILFDLEWNCAKDGESGKYINEIIEIGAVMLDGSLKEIDRFGTVVRPKTATQLNKYVKDLTHISEEELSGADDFKTVIAKFKKWCVSHGKDCVFSTWSNSDLYVLTENYNNILNKSAVDFITKYCDLQQYVSRFIPHDSNNQISLSSAAEFFGIDTEKFRFHRAEDDSRVCGELLGLTYNGEIFPSYIQEVDRNNYYKKLMFKPYYICDLNSPLIDKKELALKCPQCKRTARQLGRFRCSNKMFSAKFFCPECKKRYALSVKFKKNYDDIAVIRRIKELPPKSDRPQNVSAVKKSADSKKQAKNK